MTWRRTRSTISRGADEAGAGQVEAGRVCSCRTGGGGYTRSCSCRRSCWALRWRGRARWVRSCEERVEAL